MDCDQKVWTDVRPKLSDRTWREVIGRQGGKGGDGISTSALSIFVEKPMCKLMPAYIVSIVTQVLKLVRHLLCYRY